MFVISSICILVFIKKKKKKRYLYIGVTGSNLPEKSNIEKESQDLYMFVILWPIVYIQYILILLNKLN